MNIRRFFTKAKRNINQFFETEYWYRFRKPISLWYDEDTKKFEKSLYPENAGEILADTWNGESDLWNILLLKIDHMFYNLRKYGNEANYYFDESDVKKYSNKNDKIFLAKKTVKELLFKTRDTFWLFNWGCDESISEDGNIHFYIKASEDLKDLVLIATTSKEIPQDKIPKEKKLYTLDFTKDENGKISFANKLAKQYKDSNVIPLRAWKVEGSLEDFLIDLNIFDDLAIENIKETFGIDLQESRKGIDFIIESFSMYCPDVKTEEIHLLSEKLREHARGNFIKCRRILELRHLIKNLSKLEEIKLESPDFNLSAEERQAYYENWRKRYVSERKKAYRAIADFLAEYGDNLWD